MALALSGVLAAPLFAAAPVPALAGPAAAVLQCVPYARTVSGVEIRGDALHWWDAAEGRYKRGDKPRKGAVLAFRPAGPMTLGHVAVVSRILDDRRVLIRHANWSVPGSIEEDVLMIDVSVRGDWSAVRVWHSPTGQMGARTNPTYGFIYPDRPKLRDFTPDPALGSSVRFASIDPAFWNGVNAQAAPARPRLAMASADAPRAPASRRAPAHSPAHSTDGGMRRSDDPFIVEYADAGGQGRTLADIIADVKRQVVLR